MYNVFFPVSLVGNNRKVILGYKAMLMKVELLTIQLST